MGAEKILEVVRTSCTIRFVQGYRYLDRCGEALVLLENSLEKGWLTGNVDPQSGTLRNYRLGLAARFGSASMNVSQSEFLSFPHFLDQTCKIYDILWKTFDVERVLTPTLQVILQIGFEDVADATAHALGLDMCYDNKAVLDLMGGRKSAVSYTICTEQDSPASAGGTVQRRRVDFQVLRQEHQPDFDERVMQRLPLLPIGQRNALGDLMRLRRAHPKRSPAAVQFDLETAWEGEIVARTLRLEGFLKESWSWAEHVRANLLSV